MTIDPAVRALQGVDPARIVGWLHENVPGYRGTPVLGASMAANRIRPSN